MKNDREEFLIKLGEHPEHDLIKAECSDEQWIRLCHTWCSYGDRLPEDAPSWMVEVFKRLEII